MFLGLSPFETTSDDQEVALVDGLHPAVTYTFRIFAINSIDVSVPTDPVVAKTQEEGTKTHKYFKYIYFYLTIFLFLLSFFFLHLIAPTEPPQNIKVQSAGPGELMVSWQVNFNRYSMFH